MVKMDKKWVALCSAAVAATYATGYFSTEAQAIKMDSTSHTQISMQTKKQPSSLSKVKTNEVNGNRKSVASSTIKNDQPRQVYKDGTFTGTGMNRRGEMEVAVTLKKDKITDVQIINWGMHYSESDIAGLPDEVIQRQSANVDFVSGATYSSQAFTDAIQDALNNAKNS
ncbi:FMN-binding protein [Ectobacillus funiculus]|uniref:FMN-binding protein n=1 Tax=Ectobacillus funiculus TaxID=137993 RepID=UPI003978F411